jgi:hypothetical protein
MASRSANGAPHLKHRPPRLEEYFAEFGDPVASAGAPAPELTDDERSERIQKAGALAAQYRIEIL